MGRSIMAPREYVEVYRFAREIEEPDDGFWWEDIVEGVRQALLAKFPSLDEDERWIGKELSVILSNQHCDIIITEYCGLVAVYLVAEEHDYDPENMRGLSAHWCQQIAPTFIKTLTNMFGPRLVKLGTMSNGESVYRRAE